jgi:hypothetical protein
MDELCVTGGIVNLYEAAKKAENTKGKKKVKKSKSKTVRP